MGIIFKQSLRNLVTTYFGFGIGAVNTLFLFTYFLEKEYYGLVSFLLSAANLLWPFMAFGVHSTLVKFFSFYKTREEQDRLLNLVLLLPLLVSGLLGFLGLLSYQLLLDYFSEGNGLVRPYFWMIFVIGVCTAYFEVFFAWSKIFFRSVLGNLLKEVFHRLCISLLLFAVYLQWLSVHWFIYGVVLVFVLRSLVMGLYAFHLYRPKVLFRFPKNLGTVLKFTSLILIAGSVAMVLLDLDKVMIEYYLPIEQVAIYGIGVYIATVISVPQKAMHQITHPMTAQMLNLKDQKGLGDLYKKSSINLLVISGLIFILILTNVHELYEMIPDEYELSVWVVLLISLVKLYDNFLGNNNSILFNSDYYRMVLVIGVVLAIMAFVFNLIFIPWMGMEGAAVATFLAFGLYNTSKIYLVFSKFRLLPFSRGTLWILGITAVLTLGFYFWEFPFHPLLNIALKSLLITGIFLLLAYRMNLSPEIRTIIGKALGRMKA